MPIQTKTQIREQLLEAIHNHKIILQTTLKGYKWISRYDRPYIAYGIDPTLQDSEPSMGGLRCVLAHPKYQPSDYLIDFPIGFSWFRDHSESDIGPIHPFPQDPDNPWVTIEEAGTTILGWVYETLQYIDDPE